jgi:phosphatidylserine/phosphatidylglycerophosphate/cardiolipin synthase-like enzyme
LWLEVEPPFPAFSPGQPCRLQIQECLRAARTDVDICVFTITDDRIITAIQDAHDRGVRVRIISDNNHENIVVLNSPATVRPFQVELDKLWREFS